MTAATTVPTRVIGIGSHHGADCLGWLICDELRGLRWTQDIDIHSCRSPAHLPQLLAGCDHAILIDAIITGQQAGRVLPLGIDELDHQAHYSYSSHGLGVLEAIELARALGQLPAALKILGISVTDVHQDAAKVSRLALPGVQQSILEFRHSLQY